MGKIVELQKSRNRSTADQVAAFREHRLKTTSLIVSGLSPLRTDSRDIPTPEPDERRLCIIGIGNANDVDPSQLANYFSSITLVDIDPVALEQSRARFETEAPTAQIVTSEVDVTGIAAHLESIREVDRAAIEEAIRLSQTQTLGIGERRFDRVISTTVLSQIIDSISSVIPDTHPGHLPLVLEARRRHLRMLVEGLDDQGVGVLISDFVSSDTLPRLATLSEPDFQRACIAAIEQRNFFTGCNPFTIQHQLKNTEWFTSRVRHVHLIKPWRWDIGNKHFAVSALVFQRS